MDRRIGAAGFAWLFLNPVAEALQADSRRPSAGISSPGWSDDDDNATMPGASGICDHEKIRSDIRNGICAAAGRQAASLLGVATDSAKRCCPALDLLILSNNNCRIAPSGLQWKR